MMRAGCLILVAGILPGIPAAAWAQSASLPVPPQTEAAKAVLLRQVIDNEKSSDEAMNFYERMERVETKKHAADPAPSQIRVFRVVPAGTGVDHIPVGLDGKPVNSDVYHAELVKLEKALSWASDDGHAQRDAYERVAKKQKEREEVIDAARTAFVYTFVSTERDGGRVIFKYSLAPNPAYKATSRSTAILAKVHGFVWIDPQAAQIARVEGEVTDDISIGLFLAKVYKGSRFEQERKEVLPGLWMPISSEYDFDGRKFFSTIAVHERTYYSQFHRVGSPKEALTLIRAELDKSAAGVSDP
ncbi:MAG TPA: hypothetical protein VJN93_02560 [Candidatus Acidoferrum sp.]|nr:hypothetical protein [Candidatus Acidoferrum sp.]